jgi:hypothetical protein
LAVGPVKGVATAALRVLAPDLVEDAELRDAIAAAIDLLLAETPIR